MGNRAGNLDGDGRRELTIINKIFIFINKV